MAELNMSIASRSPKTSCFRYCFTSGYFFSNSSTLNLFMFINAAMSLCLTSSGSFWCGVLKSINKSSSPPASIFMHHHGEVTKKSIRPKLESRPLAPYLRPILTDHKWGNKIRFLKSRAGPTVTPSPSPESEPASETRNCTPRPELEVNTFHSISSFPKI